jgi:hypothetical protein
MADNVGDDHAANLTDRTKSAVGGLADDAKSKGSMQICGVNYAAAVVASSLFAGRKPR